MASQKTELLIIMTPHIVRTEADAERIKRLEAARMNWCLGDVLAVHGTEIGPKRHSNWSDAETAVVYPDNNPAGTIMIPETVAPPARSGAELIPVPAGQPINGNVPSTSPSDAPPAYPSNVPPAMPRYMSPVRPIIPPPGITPPPSPPSPPPSPLDPFPAESQPAPLAPPKETNSGVQLRLRSTPSTIGPNQGEVRAATYQGAARPVETRGYAPLVNGRLPRAATDCAATRRRVEAGHDAATARRAATDGGAATDRHVRRVRRAASRRLAIMSRRDSCPWTGHQPTHRRAPPRRRRPRRRPIHHRICKHDTLLPSPAEGRAVDTAAFGGRGAGG